MNIWVEEWTGLDGTCQALAAKGEDAAVWEVGSTGLNIA